MGRSPALPTVTKLVPGIVVVGRWDVPPEPAALRCHSPPPLLQSGVSRPWIVAADDPDEGRLARIVAAARCHDPATQFAALGPGDDLDRCQRWLSLGARVYLKTDTPVQRLIELLRLADALCLSIIDDCFLRLSRPLIAAGDPDRVSPLSRREQQVLALVGQGRSNAEIAAALSIGVHTVEFHLSNIFAKLMVRNRTAAVDKARLLGLYA